jgi:beta-lactamase superfamily II metal-dependent hydrolase
MGYEIDFLPVGDSNGDAITVRYGTDATGYTIHVVDGGFTDTAKTVIDHIEKYYGAGARIDHMILSHADNDHATGLVGVLEHFEVGAIWMNCPWLYAKDCIEAFHGNYSLDGLVRRMRELHPYLVKIEEIAASRKIPIYAAFQGTNIGQFHVLAPTRERYIALIPELDKTPQSYLEQVAAKGIGTIISDALKEAREWVKEKWGSENLADDLNTSASNETCLVQMGFFDDRRVVLTADVGPIGLIEAADYAEANSLLAPPRLFQVPHHGSRHNVSRTALNRWLGDPLPEGSANRGTAFCSVGEKKKDDYPRRIVSNAFLRRGYPVHSTKGTGKRHSENMPSRGWSSSTPEPFYDEVEG